MFTCTVRIRRYGKVRFAIIYDNPDKQGEPIYVFTNMLVWNKILSVRSHRLDIEPFHEQIKQFLGFGVSGVSPMCINLRILCNS